MILHVKLTAGQQRTGWTASLQRPGQWDLWGDGFKNWSQNRTQTQVSIWARVGGLFRESLLASKPVQMDTGERQVKNRSSSCVTPHSTWHTDNRWILKSFPVFLLAISLRTLSSHKNAEFRGPPAL